MTVVLTSQTEHQLRHTPPEILPELQNLRVVMAGAAGQDHTRGEGDEGSSDRTTKLMRPLGREARAAISG